MDTCQPVDTLPVKRCGCVPHLPVLFEEKHQEQCLDDSGVVEDIGPRREGGGWTKKIPLLGPFWCVRNTGSTTVRRRDNAVYRSNSFKFERRGPLPAEGAPIASQASIVQQTIKNVPEKLASKLDQVCNIKKPSRRPTKALVKEDPISDAAFSHQSKKPPELLVNLNYSDPQDAESDLALWGNVNQAYEAEDIVHVGEVVQKNPLRKLLTPHRQQQVIAPGPNPGYKVKLGHDIYYCKPYQPFHTQLRYNFSDLLESGVDSEYEEMAGGGAGSKWSNNNGQPGSCSQCVTVINVCPSPRHTLQQQHGGQPLVVKKPAPPPPSLQQQPPPPVSSPHQHDPPYENLSFHKVTINVPDVGEEVHPTYSDKPRVLLRKPPLRKSKVPLKYQGIKRVKSKSKTQKHVSHSSSTALDKTGYSQKEVWNWLYLEEAAKSNGLHIEAGSYAASDDGFLDDGSDGTGDRADKSAVSVQFSPVEFLAATNRLAHLNLEGFERFVGNTIDRALAGARAKSSDNVLDSPDDTAPDHDDATEVFVSDRDTDVYVGKDVTKEEAAGRNGGCGCKNKRQPVCESCLRGGDSSGCSSALSSLESVKSSLGPRSHDTDSSARGSYFSCEDYSRVATPAPGHHQDYSQVSRPGGQHDYSSRVATPAPPNYSQISKPSHQPDYMRMIPGHQNSNIYRGKIRASLPVGERTSNHKPYQTLEVGPDQGHVSHVSPGQNTLHLVDPGIQLHQQEWYHGNISRVEAEAALRLHPAGSYLVRNCESARKDYSLSLKSTHGFMHMRIQLTSGGQYILGQFSRPFNSIAEMVNYYTINRLPIKGAEHVSLRMPLCEQLL